MTIFGMFMMAIMMANSGIAAQHRSWPTTEPSVPPIVEARSYAYECPGSGLHRLDIERRNGGHTTLTMLQERGRRVGGLVKAAADARLSRFSYVENVTLQCDTDGGARYLISGAAAELISEGKRDKVAFVIRVSPQGRPTITE